MKNALHRIVWGLQLVVFAGSVSIFAEIEGTYVLEESEKSRFKWKQPELTIEIDDEGEYSAVFTESSGEVLLDTKNVEVERREFNAIFTLSSDLGDFSITYAGRVENGTLSGTITESMFGTEVQLIGELKTEDQPPHRVEDLQKREAMSDDGDLSASQSINPDIIGTYILDNQSNSRRKPELIIDQDREGKYSATLTAIKTTETDDIEGVNNEFSATFTISTIMGDLGITYAGSVENGKLSGTITESMYGSEVELIGKLKKEGKNQQNRDFD